MPGVKIGTLINRLAEKAGLDTTTQEFKDLLSVNLEIPQTINDSIVNLVDGSVEAAIKNPQIRGRLISEVMTPIDKFLEKQYEKYGLTDEDIEEINAKQNTRDKLKVFDAKVEAAYKAAKETTKPATTEDAKKLEGEIRTKLEKEWNDRVKKITQENEGKLSAKDQEFMTRELDWFIERGLGGKKLNFDEKIPQELQMMTATNGYKQFLQQNGMKLIKDASGFKVVKSDDTPVYNSKNEIFTAPDHLASYLAENNLLAVNPKPGPQPQPRNQHQVQQPAQSEFVVNEDAVAMIDEQIANLGQQ